MKVLLLSGNTGEGHNSCAGAIRDQLDLTGDESEIRDGFAFISPAVSWILSKGHSFMYRYFPGIFAWGYKYSENHPGLYKEGSFVYRLLAGGADRLYGYVSEKGFDTVISTHVFTAVILTEMMRRHPMKPRTGLLATDYTCSPSSEDSDLEHYFIPDSCLAKEFTDRGIPGEKLVVSGIPVRQIFYVPHDKREAKTLVGVDPGKKHMIIMGGSMGCGPVKEVLHKLSEKFPPDWEISMICGNNELLKDEMKLKYGRTPGIHIRGFVEDMGIMMDSADLYFTKPGGISVTEAKQKDLPMVLMDTVEGCEKHNCDYYVALGGSKTANTVDGLVEVTLSLMNNSEELEKLRSSLSCIEKKNAAKIICDTMRAQ